MEERSPVAQPLKSLFVLHFFVDVVFAFPLLLVPTLLLKFLGWETVDPVTARLTGAALMGIGIQSFLGRNASRETYLDFLRLKLIWSGSAAIGIALSICEGAPVIAWLFLGLFGLFFFAWAYWYRRLSVH